MDYQNLLNQSFSCRCGRDHTLPIRTFLYSETIYEQVASLLIEVGARDKGVVLVADERTWGVCGRAVYEGLAGFSGRSYVLVPDGSDGGPICDRPTMAWLKERAERASAGFLLAVGSGVINDLCKWVSFELDMPYGVIATAASMNGYAAANVAPLVDGVKVLIVARPPVFVGADPGVVENAPFEMTAAGFGDTLAKFMSSADWRMNHFLFGEYYCDFCCGMIDSIEQTILDRPEKIAVRERAGIRALFEALFRSGAAMTMVGTSAPASGGEHLLSHTLDMVSAASGGRHDLHGRQVGLGTIFSAALYEKILSAENLAPTACLPERIDPGYWKQAQVIASVEGHYERKKPFLRQAAEALSQPDKRAALYERLRGRMKTPSQIKQWLQQAGAAHTADAIGCGRESLLQAALHMHEMRSRFTVVDLAWLLGILPGAAEPILDQYLMG